MPTEFRFPDPGEGVHEAEVIEVLVSEGDKVEEGQSVAEIESDKAAIELPAPVSGTVKEVRIKAGDVIKVGDVLMVFLEEGEKDDAEPALPKEKPSKAQGAPAEEAEAPAEQYWQRDQRETRKSKTAATEAPKKAQKKSEEAEKAERPKGPVPAAPSTRRLARELNVDLSEVEGSGPGGRVLPVDVKTHAQKPEDAPQPQEKAQRLKERPPRTAAQLPDFSRWGPVERIPFRSIRRATAKRMTQSWENIPHVAHQDVADISDLEAFRQKSKAEMKGSGAALTLTVFALKAAVGALKAHPRFNSSLDPDSAEIVLKKYYHIGVAVDTDRGLLVPVVRDVNCKSIADLAKELPELSERTREGKIDLEEMAGATFTLTNVGSLGGTGFSPMINYPQVAILGLARARLQPVIQGDADDYKVAARLMLPLCMAFDHRVVDGADAARFLRDVISLLESPRQLMMT